LSKLRAAAGLGESTVHWAFISLLWTLGIVLLASAAGLAQEEPGRGSIQGVVIDASGAPVVGATVAVTSKFNDTLLALTTDKDGKYDSGPLAAALYTIRIEVRNFRVGLFNVTVRNGETANGDRKLVPINPGLATVTARISPEENTEFPIDGRDALNTAQFQPGVLVQDGGRLDPTKAANFALSISKASGQASDYTLDGVELTDETHGAAAQSVALSSVGELDVSRAQFDLSSGLTSSGVVRMSTRSGTENLHGEGYGLFRFKSLGFAKAPGGQDLQFQREDFGGRVGGALIKDKWFFFLDVEHVNQDGHRAVVMPAPLQSFTGSFSSPFRNTSASGKLDWNLSKTAHAFYRFAYNLNKSVDNFGDDYSIYQNHSNSPQHAIGLDFTRGQYIHSLRFGFLQYHNSLQDATSGFRPLGTAVPVNIQFNDIAGGRAQFGASAFAPQETFQRNLELRYDGQWAAGDHTFHFGGSVNRINSGGYAKAYGVAPQVATALGTGTDGNPLDYPVLFATLSNGQGFGTEKSGFGLSHGGLVDTRLQGYIGDSYRFSPNLTFTFGVHYVREDGRVDSDLAKIPCSSANASIPAAFLPCSGTTRLLDQFDNVPGQGQRVTQPNYNFGPQFGFAWDPVRNGRTIIRGGGGVFYDNSAISNIYMDRPARLSQGLYSGTNVLTCSPGAAAGTVAVYFPNAGGLPTAVRSIDGKDLATQVCGQPVGVAGGAVADLQAAYQAAVAAAGAAGNPGFVGNTLSMSLPANGLAAFGADYRTPRSYQMNLGLTREAWNGGTFTLDYVRNVSQRFGLISDTNHLGDASYLYKNPTGIPTAALNAITNTVAQKAPSCLPGVPLSVGAIVQNAISCYISTVPTANINDFAVNGLDSGIAFLGGLPATVAVQPAGGQDPRDFGAAFSGVNSLVGQGDFQISAGQAVYNGAQLGLKQRVHHQFFIFDGGDLQLAYTLSKFVTNGGDNPTQSIFGHDSVNPAVFKGPSPLDRRHQFTAAWTLDSHWGGRLAFIGRIASPAPLLPSMQVISGHPQATPGEIFRTDFSGDGTPGDLFPAKLPGPFNTLSSSTLASEISNYNSSQAGGLTPAGQALVSGGLFTQPQLATLHGNAPYVVVPPAGQFSNEIFKSLDAAISWPLKVGERLTIEPSARFLNVFNFANFQPVSGQLTYYYPGPGQPVSGGAGSANGTPSGPSRDVLRIGSGSGVYNNGAPRQMEFGVKVTF